MHNNERKNHSTVFLSTPSARRATRVDGEQIEDWQISIHALREEGDDEGGVYTITLEAFLSTPSVRRTTAIPENPRRGLENFYPRPP